MRLSLVQKESMEKMPNSEMQRYLFGIIDIISHKAYMQFIPKKDHRNIIPIIERHVNAGCTINSDGG